MTSICRQMQSICVQLLLAAHKSDAPLGAPRPLLEFRPIDVDQHKTEPNLLKEHREACYNKEADLSETIKSEAISRRKAFSLLGLAVALSAAVPATVLTVAEEAVAQTAGMVRRQARRINRSERRQTRRTARTERRAVRRGVAPAAQ